MATPETDPLWFISFDAPLKIVFDDQLWKLFECYLTTKELLQATFTEIAPIRNRHPFAVPGRDCPCSFFEV